MAAKACYHSWGHLYRKEGLRHLQQLWHTAVWGAVALVPRSLAELVSSSCGWGVPPCWWLPSWLQSSVQVAVVDVAVAVGQLGWALMTVPSLVGGAWSEWSAAAARKTLVLQMPMTLPGAYLMLWMPEDHGPRLSARTEGFVSE